MANETTVSGYNLNKANKYDKESKVIRGDREKHKKYLLDILNYIKTDQRIFMDLGCGTGDLTRTFFEVFPNITGYLIDSSEEMLNKAKKKLVDINPQLIFKCATLENFDWSVFKEKPDIIFSSFAIHHLENNHKNLLYQKIFQNLKPKGIFILFDYFKTYDPRSNELIEFISCMDIKRRALAELHKDIEIEQIIKKDREAKAAEGDKEASLSEHVEHFAKIGFKSVTIIFQEARLAGIIGFKT